MFGVSVFDLTDGITDGLILANGEYARQVVVNGIEETLNTEVFVNEILQNGYRRMRIVNDEVIAFQARALQTQIDELIVRQSYEVFLDLSRRRLVAMCSKQNADDVKEVIENQYNLAFRKHAFRVDRVIAASTNVRGARFRRVRLQTVRGSSIGGDNVNTTDLYQLLAANGELAQITCKLDTMGTTVSFALSLDGSLLMYTPLDPQRLLLFVEELFSISNEGQVAD